MIFERNLMINNLKKQINGVQQKLDNWNERVEKE